MFFKPFIPELTLPTNNGAIQEAKREKDNEKGIIEGKGLEKLYSKFFLVTTGNNHPHFIPCYKPCRKEQMKI